MRRHVCVCLRWILHLFGRLGGAGAQLPGVSDVCAAAAAPCRRRNTPTNNRRNPAPFHKLAKELFPGEYTPTPTHFFMHLLHQKGLLLRCFRCALACAGPRLPPTPHGASAARRSGAWQEQALLGGGAEKSCCLVGFPAL